MRLGLGPVFAYEWLMTTRRWQLYALRAGFVGVILVGMMFVWQNVDRHRSPGQAVSIQTLATYGESLYKTVVSIELTLVLLAAPAATAGAICLDKARGTLDHMLATDLSNAEIVLGKLGARLVPVLGLIACVLPIAALAGLLGGIDPTALFGSFLTAIACAFLGCSLALTLSVWGRKTHEVLMVTYLILILWLISPFVVMMVAYALQPSPSRSLPARSLEEWLGCSNPYYLAFAPYTIRAKSACRRISGSWEHAFASPDSSLGLATRRIRGVALAQAGQRPSRSPPGRFASRLSRPAWLPRLPAPSLDGNPVLWREWQRSQPSRFLRVVWLLYTGLGDSLDRAVLLPQHRNGRSSGRNRSDEHVSGRSWATPPERERRDQPRRGAGARQPRRPAGHAALHPFDPGRGSGWVPFGRLLPCSSGPPSWPASSSPKAAVGSAIFCCWG